MVLPSLAVATAVMAIAASIVASDCLVLVGSYRYV